MKLLDPKYCPDTKMNVVSDSAFPCLTAMAGRILTPLKNGDIDRILPSLRSSARTLHNAITSVRQAAEWGMGSVQKVYSRLSLPLPYGSYGSGKLRGLCLNNLFRTANFRVRTVAISQIRTTSAGEMEVPAQLSKVGCAILAAVSLWGGELNIFLCLECVVAMKLLLVISCTCMIYRS
ncbi:hypothetical protein PF010_g25687 [Phytophthora fragariae]|uniref:DDE Tnp4 domain-containing protein n=1 Tax=Phytophthora fragariae TaxID=53985 RepID=A0A6G0JZ03_9STRA|nr:hypothetical protein PF010_g25687 [Phytophthora fragariae]